MITIKWLGHSCMKVDWDGYRVVFDPFQDGSVPGFGNIREEAELVLCTHGHFDHNAAELVTVSQGGKAPFQVISVAAFHDEENGTKRGENTIFLLQNEEWKIVHMGDIGCRLTKEQNEILKDADVVMTPVGGYYTAEPGVIKEMMDRLGARVVIPMHYRSASFGFEELAQVEEYTKLCDNVKVYFTNTLEITKEMPSQTAVLTYC